MIDSLKHYSFDKSHRTHNSKVRILVYKWLSLVTKSKHCSVICKNCVIPMPG